MQIISHIKLDRDRILPQCIAYIAECTANRTNTVDNHKYMQALSTKRAYIDRKISDIYVDEAAAIKLVQWGLYV